MYSIVTSVKHWDTPSHLLIESRAVVVSCLVLNCKQIRTRANDYNWIPQASTVPVVSPHNRPSPASLARFTVHLSKAETSMFIWLRSLKGTSNSLWNFNTTPVASHIVRYLIDNPTGKTSPTSKVATLEQSIVKSLFAFLPIKCNQKSSSGSGSDSDIRFLCVSLVFSCHFFLTPWEEWSDKQLCI